MIKKRRDERSAWKEGRLSRQAMDVGREFHGLLREEKELFV